MLETIWSSISQALGLEAEELTLWQMALRALIVYVATIVMIRVGEKRFLGKNTAFDVILGIVLGSVVSRAITNTLPFFVTLGAGFVLVGIHWLFAVIAFHSDNLGTLFKGRERVLVKDGEIQWDEMQASHISERDLIGALRTNARVESVEEVEVARLERSGDISVIKRDRKPKIIEVKVEDGVQTVRIEVS